MVGRPSQMSGSGRKALPDVWEWSGGLTGCPLVVVSGPEALPVVREWSGEVGMHSLMSGSGREALPDLRDRSGGPLDVR